MKIEIMSLNKVIGALEGIRTPDLLAENQSSLAARRRGQLYYYIIFYLL